MTYDIDKFNEEWWVDGEPLAFQDVKQAHATRTDERINRADEFWFAVHKEGLQVTVYVYEVDGWSEEDSQPWSAEPMFLVIGTTFDGVRETQGCPSSTGNLKRFAAALIAVDEYFNET